MRSMNKVKFTTPRLYKELETVLRLGPGSSWGRVLEKAPIERYTMVHGACTGVGVGGFLLGGGFNYAGTSRRLGSGSSNVLEYTLVDADGDILKVSYLYFMQYLIIVHLTNIFTFSDIIIPFLSLNFCCNRVRFQKAMSQNLITHLVGIKKYIMTIDCLNRYNYPVLHMELLPNFCIVYLRNLKYSQLLPSFTLKKNLICGSSRLLQKVILCFRYQTYERLLLISSCILMIFRR